MSEVTSQDQTTNQDQTQESTMPKPKQPRRELKPKGEKTPKASEEVTITPKAKGEKKTPKRVIEAAKANRIAEEERMAKREASEKTQDAPEASQDAPGQAKGKKKAGTDLAKFKSAQPILEALSDDEVILREQLEYEVQQGIEVAFKVAGALLQIRENRLYRSTHGTYEEYVEDKWEMSVRRARHLTFAAGVVRNLEDSGVTTLPTNERQVRELAGVNPEDHAKVWTKAQEVAAKKGKKEPGREEVREAASKVGRPKGAKNSKQTPEQKKVQKAVDAGAIKPDTVVDTTFVDEGVETAMVADIDLPDKEWLAQFPIRDQLNDYCRTLFDEEALFYRWFSPHRKPLVRDVTAKLAAEVRRVAKRVGPYVTRIEKALSLADPRTWVVCKSCNGTGYITDGGACSDCRNAGYRLG